MLHCKLTILEREKANEAFAPSNSDAHASNHGVVWLRTFGKSPPSQCRPPFAGISYLRGVCGREWLSSLIGHMELRPRSAPQAGIVAAALYPISDGKQM
jgi:hypothetical protein